MKKCTKCHIEKELCEFEWRLGMNKHRAQCKTCVAIRRALYYQRTKDERCVKVALYQKSWRIKNIETVKKKSHDYFQTNKREIASKTNKRFSQRYKDEPKFNRDAKDSAFLRGKLRKFVNGENILQKTHDKFYDLCGINFSGMVKWLEMTHQANYNSKMDWEKWKLNLKFDEKLSIDHRIPVSSVNTLDVSVRKKCWHFTNLQILTAKDNSTKGNKQF